MHKGNNRHAQACPLYTRPDWILRFILSVLNKKRLDFESAIVLAIALLGKLFPIFKTLVPLKMAFFTNVIDLQAALSACLTVRDWEMLTEAVQIPENFVPLAFARLTELTLQDIEVSFILHWSLLPSLIQSITILFLL